MNNIHILIKQLMLLIAVQLVAMQFFVTPAYAKNDFFEQRYRGWLWFDESSLESEQEIEEEQSPHTAAPTKELMLQAKAENEEFSKELELLKHLAIRYPDNLEYIKLYKLKEKEMMDNAGKLGVNWLMVNFLNPEIIDELANPQNIYGRDIKTQEQQRVERIALQDVAKKVELFVFRKDGCPYCSTLEKHLKTFATKYGFAVEAISPDSTSSKYFKTYSSPKMIAAFGLEVMPTVIAVVKDTRQRFELARGAVSVIDLEEKALLLEQYLKQVKPAPVEQKFKDRGVLNQKSKGASCSN